MLSIEIQKIHKQHPDMGYRRIRDEDVYKRQAYTK